MMPLVVKLLPLSGVETETYRGSFYVVTHLGSEWACWLAATVCEQNIKNKMKQKKPHRKE